MTNKDITKIYFRGNEIVALYRGDTLIFRKSGGGSTGVYKIKGTVNDDAKTFTINYNCKSVTITVNDDKTFEYTTDEVLTDADMMCSLHTNLTSLDVSNLDTSKVTNMRGMFFNNENLTSLDLSTFNTSNVTNMAAMFKLDLNLTSLDVSNFDTSKVTNMEGMFESLENLTSLDVSNFDTSKVTNMMGMLAYLSNITSLDVSNFDTSKVNQIKYLFCFDSKLENLYLNFNLNQTDDMYLSTFEHCVSLKNVVGKFEGAKYDLDLSFSPLTPDSAMVFINGLATVTEKRTLHLSRTTYDSLTNEQIAIATSKGWTVTRS